MSTRGFNVGSCFAPHKELKQSKKWKDLEWEKWCLQVGQECECQQEHGEKELADAFMEIAIGHVCGRQDADNIDFAVSTLVPWRSAMQEHPFGLSVVQPKSRPEAQTRLFTSWIGKLLKGTKNEAKLEAVAAALKTHSEEVFLDSGVKVAFSHVSVLAAGNVGIVFIVV